MWPRGAAVAGSREMEGDKAWILAPCAPNRLGPGAINYNLIEGYRGDPAVTERRKEVVIEEGVPFALFLPLFPARELRRLEQYWCWRGAAASIA